MRGNKNPLSNTIKDTSKIMRNPSLHNSGKGVTHDCSNILDSIAKGILVSTIFRMVHPIPTSPFIQLNDFCTCTYTNMHVEWEMK